MNIKTKLTLKLAEVFSRLKVGTFVRHVILLTGATVFGQALQIAISPVLTRIYTPNDFGIFAVFASILGLPLTIASWRYERAILLPDDKQSAAGLLVLSIFILLFVILCLGIPTLLWGVQLVEWFNAPELAPYFWILFLSLFGGGVYQIFTFWAMRDQAFGLIGKTKLTQSIAQVLAQVVGGVYLGTTGLLIGDALGRSMGSVNLATNAWRKHKAAIKSVTSAVVKNVARTYGKISSLSTIATFFDSVGQRVPSLLIASYYGLKVLGFFTLAQQVTLVSVVLIGKSVSQVYTSEAARLVRHSPNELKSFFLNSTKKLLLVCVLPLGVVMLGGRWLFASVFGQDWEEAGTYAQLLIPMVLASAVTLPLGSTLYVLDRQDLELAWVLGKFVVGCAALMGAGLLGWSASKAIMVYSLAQSCVYVVYFFIILVTINRLKPAHLKTEKP